MTSDGEEGQAEQRGSTYSFIPPPLSPTRHPRSSPGCQWSCSPHPAPGPIRSTAQEGGLGAMCRKPGLLWESGAGFSPVTGSVQPMMLFQDQTAGPPSQTALGDPALPQAHTATRRLVRVHACRPGLVETHVCTRQCPYTSMHWHSKVASAHVHRSTHPYMPRCMTMHPCRHSCVTMFIRRPANLHSCPQKCMHTLVDTVKIIIVLGPPGIGGCCRVAER